MPTSIFWWANPDQRLHAIHIKVIRLYDGGVLLSILQRTIVSNRFELPVEIRQRIESTLVTHLRNVHRLIGEQFATVAYAYFR